MVESVGKKLVAARTTRGLSLEEAAMETRIRPTQIAALEADDYSSFANNTYARGFLLMYGKFLGVDVRAFARELETGNPISMSDYQYLNAPSDDEERPAGRKMNYNHARADERRRPSIVPLVVFILMLALVGFGAHLYIQAQRLDVATTPSTPAPDSGAVEATPATSGTTSPAVAAKENPNGPITPVSPSATPTPTVVPAAQTGTRTLPTVPPSTTTSALVPNPNAATSTPAVASNELIVEPIKKTWVRIRRDDPSAEPLYDDVVYPKAGPLKMKGSKFWVEIRDADAVTIRKNGQALAYQPPGIAIQ